MKKGSVILSVVIQILMVNETEHVRTNYVYHTWFSKINSQSISETAVITIIFTIIAQIYLNILNSNQPID